MKYYATKLSNNIAETPEGFLVCLGVSIARVGDYEYGADETPLEAGDDGIIVISRDPEEVFSPKTIASFEGKPFTINHPEEFVNPDNWSQLAKGVTQNVRRGTGDQKDDLVADILITDALAISLVKNGLRGLSCGYEAEYTQTGEGRGKQTKIVGNHLALVEEGRAGTSYAINDEKGKHMKNKTLAEKLKTLFGKAIDEATKEDPPAEKKSEDAGAYDELVKMCKDLAEKISGMKPEGKDEADPAEKKDDKKKKDGEGQDDDAEGSNGMEDRLKALETAVAKILEKMSVSDEGEEEESEDEDGDGEEESESEDDAEVVSSVTGDTASRAEILSPGIKANAKEIKVNALKAAYGTKDGKQVIDSLTGGKPPAYDKPETVDTLFVAASELLKSSRGKELSNSKKTFDFQSNIFEAEGAMTPEKMNKINDQLYNSRK